MSRSFFDDPIAEVSDADDTGVFDAYDPSRLFEQTEQGAKVDGEDEPTEVFRPSDSNAPKAASRGRTGAEPGELDPDDVEALDPDEMPTLLSGRSRAQRQNRTTKLLPRKRSTPSGAVPAALSELDVTDISDLADLPGRDSAAPPVAEREVIGEADRAPNLEISAIAELEAVLASPAFAALRPADGSKAAPAQGEALAVTRQDRSGESLESRARAVELVVLDVDGTLTDGGLYYGPEGEALKRFDVKDGHAIVLARRLGMQVAILTARSSRIVERRGEELGIDPIVQGFKDKARGFERLLAEVGLGADQVAYIGDDVNDLGPMRRARLAACPADACEEIRRLADYQARASGGRGAVREVLELILRAQDKWAPCVESLAQPGSWERG